MRNRQDERHGLVVNGRYRTGKGLPMDIVLRDLSRSGCQIHDRLGRLEIDQFLTIRIGPIGPIESRVRWLDGRRAGIMFNTPLNEAVLDHVRTLADPAPYRQPLSSPNRSILSGGPQDRPGMDGAAGSRAMNERDSARERPLNLLPPERRFNEILGALTHTAVGDEVLIGLDRRDSDWLTRWRRESRNERAARPNYNDDIYEAERLEEVHLLARRAHQGF